MRHSTPTAHRGRLQVSVPLSNSRVSYRYAAAAEAFDATFPEKEKKWMPSQEEFYIYRHSSVVR